MTIRPVVSGPEKKSEVQALEMEEAKREEEIAEEREDSVSEKMREEREAEKPDDETQEEKQEEVIKEKIEETKDELLHSENLQEQTEEENRDKKKMELQQEIQSANHIIGDLFTGADWLGDPDDFDLLGYRPVEERSQAEADEEPTPRYRTIPAPNCGSRKCRNCTRWVWSTSSSWQWRMKVVPTTPPY